MGRNGRNAKSTKMNGKVSWRQVRRAVEVVGGGGEVIWKGADMRKE